MSTLVASFGEIMLRLSPPSFERFLQTPQFVATFGGAEANVAVSLSNLGTPSRFITVLPALNPMADAAVGELRRFGVDTDQIVRHPGRMGIYFVETGSNQRPSKVVYDREGSSIAKAGPGTVRWESALQGVTWFHLSGITPALSESCAALAEEALAYCKGRSITTSCDLNFRKNLWRWGKPASEVMPALVRWVDHLIANEEDCQKALGMHVDIDVESGHLERAKFEELSSRVLSSFENLRSVSITMRESTSASHNGWSACMATRDGSFCVSKTYQITHIVDRVGAGDMFAAGLIHKLTANASHEDALAFAVAASCLKHSIPGDFSRMPKEEVESLLAGGGAGRVLR